MGLHFAEEEPTPRKEAPEPPLEVTGGGEMAGRRARVRPELHQFRMFAVALGGYVLLKGMSVAGAIPRALQYLSEADATNALSAAFQFGFVYVALGWFILWQLLRWLADQQQWVRLQDELVGSDVAPMIAAVMLIKPLVFFGTLAFGGGDYLSRFQIAMWTLVHLAIILGAAVLWQARPYRLRRTVAGLFLVSGIIVILAIIQVVFELLYYRAG